MGTVNLLAVFDTWTSAGHSFDKASQALAKAADQLCHELTAAGSAWGDDDLGQAFFNGGQGKPGFGTSRDQVLPQIGDMVNVLAGTGDALVTAGAEYLQAEHSVSQRLGGKPGDGAKKPTATGSTYHMPPFDSAATMSDPPPGGLVWMMDLVESLVAGCAWPDGSTSALGQISRALSGMATALGQAVTDVSSASAQVLGSNVGQGAENFAEFARVLVQALEQLQQACQGLASSVDNLIAQKQAARIQFIASMVFLVASFFVAQALAVWTLGASEAEFFATAEVEGWTLRMLFRLLAKGVLEGLWYGAGMDAIGQVSRIITGAQQGWNWAEFGKAAGEGAVAGAVMSGLGGAARFTGGRSAVVKALFNVMDGKVDDPSAMTKLAGFGARVGLNSATGFAGNVASQAAFDDGNVNWAQAGNFAVGMAVMGEGINLLTPGEHAKAPDTDPTLTTDVPAAIDAPREPAAIQEALGTTLHGPSADGQAPAITDSDDKPPPPPPPGGPGGTPTLEGTATTPSATQLASITTHDPTTADPTTPAPATPANGDHPGAIPVITAGHDGPAVLADHPTAAAPDTAITDSTPGGGIHPADSALSPADTITPQSPTETGVVPERPADPVGAADPTVGSPASSHDTLASAGRDPADAGTEIHAANPDPTAQTGPGARPPDLGSPQHVGDGATVPEDAPPATDLATVGQVPATHDLTSPAHFDDEGTSSADPSPASDAISPADVAGNVRQVPMAAEDQPLADGGRAGTWDVRDDATRTGRPDDVLDAGDGRDVSGVHADQETLPDDGLDRELADLLNSDHGGGFDRELDDLLNSDHGDLAFAGSHGAADDPVFYSGDGHVSPETPTRDVAPHDDQGLPRDDTNPAGQDHDPARDDTNPAGRDHDPARDDTNPAGRDHDPARDDANAPNHAHSPAHHDASAPDHGHQAHDSVSPGDHSYPPGTEVVHVDLTGTAFEPPEAHRGLVELGGDYRTEDGEKIPLLNGRPAPEQVAQGALRNCFAMAVLRSIARTDPDAIADNIWENPDGTITVRLYEPKIVLLGARLTGRIVEIRMSKELPVYADDPTRPAYANVRRGGAAWPGYYERAFAAINEGGFARLDEGGGGPHIAGFLAEVTGKPSFYDVDDDPYRAAANWKKQLDAGNPVIVGTKPGLESPKFNLFSPHAYEVVDVVNDHVILRNPHGRNDPDPIPLSEWSDHFTHVWASHAPAETGQHEAPAPGTAGGDRVATDPASARTAETSGHLPGPDEGMHPGPGSPRAEPTSARPDTTAVASGGGRHPASGDQATVGADDHLATTPSHDGSPLVGDHASTAHGPAASFHGGDTHSADPGRSSADVAALPQHPADAGVVPRAPADPAHLVANIPRDPGGPVFRNADPDGGLEFTPHAEVRFGPEVGIPGKLDLSPGHEVLIGRGDESPLRLAFRKFDNVSRRHATMGADPDGTPWIRDEGSTNGTFLNGEQIPAGEKIPLPPGRVTIRLGDEADIHISVPDIPRAHDPGNVAPDARAAAAAPQAPDAVLPDIAPGNADQPPHAEIRFGLEVGRPGKLDVSPGQEVLIGRDEQSPLHQALWPYNSVSRRHATIGADSDGTPWIRDEGSSYGTFVNGERIPVGERVTLPEGAVVRLGGSADLHIARAGVPRGHDPADVSPAEAHTVPGAAPDVARPEAARPDIAHPEAHTAPVARAAPDPARENAAHPEAVRQDAGRPDIAPGNADQPPHAEIRFGLEMGRPGKLDVSPGQEVLIGRDEQSPLHQALSSFDGVSRRHATFGADTDGRPWIRDEGSTNGTFINGERIPAGEKVPVPDGAVVRLGEANLHISGAGVPRGHDPADVSPGEAHTPPVARAAPDAGRPDAARPDIARPDIAHPGAAHPAHPDAAHPDAARAAHRELARGDVPRGLRRIVADHPGLLDAPRRLSELRENLRPGVSFEDMRALRELSYHLNGIDPPELSRESFDEFLGKVWSHRSEIVDSRGVYREYSGAIEKNPLTRSAGSYMDEVARIADGRTPGSIQPNTNGIEVPDELTPGNLADVNPAGVGFVHFHRDYADPDSVSQRVYVNARADSAPALMHAIVHEVLDNPRQFPGIYEAKVAGPGGAGRRSDNIVIYTNDEASSQHVISWLKKYQSKHDAFMWSAPAMTKQVMEGVSMGAEPLDTSESFGGVRANAVFHALAEAMTNGDDYAGFLARALSLLPSYQIDPRAPHMNG